MYAKSSKIFHSVGPADGGVGVGVNIECIDISSTEDEVKMLQKLFCVFD
jgi:hypothetical protein